MRYILFLTVCLITLILILIGINPQLSSQREDGAEISDAVLFKKATGNISRLKSAIENCVKVSEENTETEEAKEVILLLEQKLLKELELIIAYQNKTIAKYKYEEIQSKSLNREVSPADVQKAYRELESAELYLSRLLENYPQGAALFK